VHICVQIWGRYVSVNISLDLMCLKKVLAAVELDICYVKCFQGNGHLILN